ncbi:MAG: AMP-binding protein, partial [Blastocatellia bacterium]|nr:AMP-binding protein [Blastocatellia bacterium]
MTQIVDRKAVPLRRTDRGEPLYDNEPTTLPELFLQSFDKHDLVDALNVKRDGEWKPISSTVMRSRIEQIAFGLVALGLQTGDRAAILASNSPEWTLTDAGCQFAGVVDVPIYTTLAPHSIEYILNDSGAKVIFLENLDAYGRIADVLDRLGSDKELIFFDAEGLGLPNSRSL